MLQEHQYYSDSGSLSRYLPDGTLDTGFSTISVEGLFADYDLQASGEIVALGTQVTMGTPNVQLLLNRFSNNGTKEATFDTATINQDQPGGDGAGGGNAKVAVLPSGSVLAATCLSIYQKSAVVFAFRWTTAGHLDAQFGSQGMASGSVSNWGCQVSAIFPTQDGGTLMLITYQNQGPDLLAIDSSGKASPVIPLQTSDGGTLTHSNDYASLFLGSGFLLVDQSLSAVREYSFSGAPNSSFGKGGIGGVASWSVFVVQSDQKIVAAGSSGVGSNSIVLQRFDITGAEDPSFGNGGLSVVEAQNAVAVDAITVLSDGSLSLVLTNQTGETDVGIPSGCPSATPNTQPVYGIGTIKLSSTGS